MMAGRHDGLITSWYDEDADDDDDNDDDVDYIFLFSFGSFLPDTMMIMMIQ